MDKPMISQKRNCFKSILLPFTNFDIFEVIGIADNIHTPVKIGIKHIIKWNS